MSFTQTIIRCCSCSQTYPADTIIYRCGCGGILDIDHQREHLSLSPNLLQKRRSDGQSPYDSGVWRYKELIADIPHSSIISKPEGNTILYACGKKEATGQNIVGAYANVADLTLKHEGENPTGSFKDRGMTVAVSMAKFLNAKAVACASTGNTSSSLASYAAKAQLPCFIFLPKGNVSSSKLSQTLAYGATTIALDGDFDDCMAAVEQVAVRHSIYLANSLNPWRIEGQKSIAYELLQQWDWTPPDWIVVPGGNLGNTSAIGKALLDLHRLGWIKTIPRLAVIQAHGANPFFRSFLSGFRQLVPVQADTIATAIRIGNPMSFARAKVVIESTNGLVEEVTDEEILAAKAVIDRAGIGCEPGSATTVAGVKKLAEQGKILSSDRVVCILTGHVLKDPQASLQAHATTPTAATKATVEKTVARLLTT